MRFGGFAGRRYKVKLATVNVRSLRRSTAERLQLLKGIAVSGALYALTVCETRLPGTGTMDLEEGWVFVHHNTDPDRRGVGIVLSPAAAEAWRLEGSTMERDTLGRALSIRLRSAGRECPWHIAVAYSPTATATDGAVDMFFQELSAVIQKVPRRRFLWLGGDLNSRVGIRQRHEDHLSDVLGPYGINCRRNHMGDRLLLFCQAQGLRITNGFYRNPVQRTATWYHPRWKHPAVLDVSMIRIEHSACVIDTTVKPGVETGSDHALLVAVFRHVQNLRFDIVPARVRTADALRRPEKINVAALKDPDVQARYAQALDAKLQARPGIPMDELSAVVTECAVEHVGLRNKNQPTWLAENQREVRELAEDRLMKYQDYKRVRTTTKRAVHREAVKRMRHRMREMEEQWFREKADQIETSWEDRDSRGFFQRIAVLAREFPGGGIRRRAVGAGAIDLHGFCDHFSRVLNVSRDVDWTVVNELPSFTPNVGWDAPTEEDVRSAIRFLKDGKAEGLSGVPAECIKRVPIVATALHRYIVSIWDNAGAVPVVPSEWLEAVLVALYKNKGEYTDPDNWRGIVLLDILSKVVNVLLNWRLQQVGEAIWGEEQHGFRKNRGTVDCIFVLRRMVEEFGLTDSAGGIEDKLYVLFVDLKKAFDSCDRRLIWLLLGRCGVPGNVVALVRAFHDGFGARVLFAGGMSDRFPMTTGVRQGCCCGPTLWNIYFFFAMRLWRDRCRLLVPAVGVRCSYVTDLRVRSRQKLERLKSKRVCTVLDLQYADDTAVFCRDLDSFRRCTELLDETISLLGGEVSLSKTEWMCIPHEERPNATISLRGSQLAQVTTFKYLGSAVAVGRSGYFGSDDDTGQRIAKASAAFGKLRGAWSSTLTLRTKGKIFLACVGTILVYGVEASVLSRGRLLRMKRFWYGCLKSIANLRNHTSFRDLCRDFDVPDIRVLVKRRLAGYMGHLARMDASRMPFQLAFGHAQGRAVLGARRRGQVKTVMGCYDEIAAELPGVSSRNWPLQAQDRSLWRSAVRQLQPIGSRDGGSFACREMSCGQLFENARLRQRHEERSHVATATQEGAARCSYCGKECKNDAGVKIHVGRYCKLKPVTAAAPAHASSASADAGVVLPARPPPHPPPRELSSSPAPSASAALFREVGEGHSLRFQCTVCGITRRSHATIMRHINSTHGENRQSEVLEDLPSPQCAPIGATGEAGFTEDPARPDSVVCNKCQKSVTRKNWARHDNRCGLRFVCDLCSREFGRRMG